MFKLKTTATAVLLAVCGSSFAGTMGPVCTPGNITVPCEARAWDVGIQALYLRPTFSGQSNTYNFFGNTLNGSHITLRENKMDWAWGFRLEGSYHFGTGSDVNLNWIHYNHTTRLAPITFVSLISGLTNVVNFVSRKTQWDAVNAEFAQHVDFGVFKNIRFHGGLQYAHLRYNEFVTGTIAGAAILNNDRASFNGLGPRVGLDMSYDFTSQFALYGKAAVAMVVGNVVFDNNTLTAGAHASSFQVIPELEAKLGGTYTYGMSRGDLILDAGYMFTNYFSVLTQLPPTNLSSSSFAFQGPYIGLKYIGNW
jgi:hypothetical protein